MPQSSVIFASGVIVSIGLCFIIFYAFWARKKKIDAKTRAQFFEKLDLIAGEKDIHKQILFFDQLLEKVLKARGYKKNVGAVLKAHPYIFQNIHQIWFAHKLRNRLAHELDYVVSAAEAQKARHIFQKEIRALIRL